MKGKKNLVNDTFIYDIILILIGGLILREKEIYFYIAIVILGSFSFPIIKTITKDIIKNINL